ncbi:MAG: hypothetical protein K2X55_12330 [Burkholderiaceae bacterium]|nr:hypothetical protein [Burkholderiaceae bacterium]
MDNKDQPADPPLRIPARVLRNLGMNSIDVDYLCTHTPRNLLMHHHLSSSDIGQLERELARIGRALAQEPQDQYTSSRDLGRYEVTINVWVPLATDQYDPVGIVYTLGDGHEQRVDLLQALEASALECDHRDHRETLLRYTALDLRRIADRLELMARQSS